MDTPTLPEADELEDSRDLSGVSLRTMRRNGLAYAGGGHIPDFPMRALTGDDARRLILTRAQLDSVLATGLYTMIPDAPPPEPAKASKRTTGTTDSGDAQKET